MRLLFDECVSRLFKAGFAGHGHECFTVPEVGLAGRKNGELLTLAEGKFDVFVTIDKNIRYQQNLSGRKIAILIIRARSSSFGPDRRKSTTFFSSYQPVLLHFSLFSLVKSSKLEVE